MRRWFHRISCDAYSTSASTDTGTAIAMVVMARVRMARPSRQMATTMRYSRRKGIQKKVVFTAPSGMSDDQRTEAMEKPAKSMRGRSSGVVGQRRSRVPSRSIHHSTAIPMTITA